MRVFIGQCTLSEWSGDKKFGEINVWGTWASIWYSRQNWIKIQYLQILQNVSIGRSITEKLNVMGECWYLFMYRKSNSFCLRPPRTSRPMSYRTNKLWWKATSGAPLKANPFTLIVSSTWHASWTTRLPAYWMAYVTICDNIDKLQLRI